MKKLLTLAVATLGMAVYTNAQTLFDPFGCNNSNLIEGEINQCDGWIEDYRQYAPINYLVQPESPFTGGRVEVYLRRDCAPNVPCQGDRKLLLFDVIITNDQGTCRYAKVNPSNQ